MLKMRASILLFGLVGTLAMLPLTPASAAQVGHASWYALHSRTASGEIMNPNALTAAHRSLPFGTHVLVQNLSNGRSVVVRINDRGPFVSGRIIDVSKAAASALGMLGSGTATVRISTTGRSTTRARSADIRGSMRSAASWHGHNRRDTQVASRTSSRHTRVASSKTRTSHQQVQLAEKNDTYGIFGSHKAFFKRDSKGQVERVAERD